MDLESDRDSLFQNELHQANLPALKQAIAAYAKDPKPFVPRSYDGYPQYILPKVRARYFGSLERALTHRFSQPALEASLPSSAILSRMLWFAHGQYDSSGRGPVPSAGGLSALHLYLIVFPCQQSSQTPWLLQGAYHYQRDKHLLSRICDTANRQTWEEIVPSLSLFQGGSILFVIVGDTARVFPKYLFRTNRYLLLEAGHLMQNLCLLSSQHGVSTVPLGGIFEADIARSLHLPRQDMVLYAGICGQIPKP